MAMAVSGTAAKSPSPINEHEVYDTSRLCYWRVRTCWNSRHRWRLFDEMNLNPLYIIRVDLAAYGVLGVVEDQRLLLLLYLVVCKSTEYRIDTM